MVSKLNVNLTFSAALGAFSLIVHGMTYFAGDIQESGAGVTRGTSTGFALEIGRTVH